MEKKNYDKPKMKIIKVRRPMIICDSGNYSGGGEGGGGAPQFVSDEEIWFEKERNDKDNDEKELMDDGRYAETLYETYGMTLVDRVIQQNQK